MSTQGISASVRWNIYRKFTGHTVPQKFDAIAEKYLSRFEKAQEAARAVYGLFSRCRTVEDLLARAQVSTYCGAAYRPQMIESISEYLRQPERVKEDAIGYKNVPGELQTECFLYTSLGDALSGEYMLAQAVQAYMKGAQAAPMYMHNYVKAAKTLVKMGQFEAAKRYIDGAILSGEQWREDEKRDFQLCLDFIQKKKESGYVYKPRPRKSK